MSSGERLTCGPEDPRSEENPAPDGDDATAAAVFLKYARNCSAADVGDTFWGSESGGVSWNQNLLL